MLVHNPYSTNHVFRQFSVCLQITSASEEMGGGSPADLLTTIQDKGFTHPQNIYFPITENRNAVPRKCF